MKKQKQADEDCDNGIYPILKTPNFYFPMADIGKKFQVEDTYNLIIKDKDIIKKYNIYKKDRGIFLMEYADIFWRAIHEHGLDKKYKDCWLVPIRISAFGKELEVDIDVLRPVRSNKNRNSISGYSKAKKGLLKLKRLSP